MEQRKISQDFLENEKKNFNNNNNWSANQTIVITNLQ